MRKETPMLPWLHPMRGRHGERYAGPCLTISVGQGRKKSADQIPVPGIPPEAGSRILQRLELKPLSRNTDGAPVGEKLFTVRRNQMGHRVALPSMTV